MSVFLFLFHVYLLPVMAMYNVQFYMYANVTLSHSRMLHVRPTV